jgi:hypothetical protein
MKTSRLFHLSSYAKTGRLSATTRVVAVLMLAVTIAASTAASAVVHAAVLASLGVPDSDRLLNIEPLRDLPGRGAVVFNESYPNHCACATAMSTHSPLSRVRSSR